VTFQDGTPFDAQAVKWNLERVLDPATGSDHRQKFEGIIQGVQAVDPYTIYLTRPYPALFSDLTDRPGQMVSPAAVKKFGKAFALQPVGIGPFKFVEWIPGNRVVVQRYENYWNRSAIKSDGIVFYDIPERPVAVARLQSGEGGCRGQHWGWGYCARWSRDHVGSKAGRLQGDSKSQL
jgi:ABC-type transport system substrate-binding protein